jgi:(R,R)-butanediol dehydrogenase / meso-butanediol dehydrogenase / diacetyl reductase
VANGATIAAVGIFHAKLDFDPNVVVERELSLKGCSAFADELPQAIGLLPELADDLRQFIEEEIGLDAVPDAYRRLLSGETAGLKTIVRPT